MLSDQSSPQLINPATLPLLVESYYVSNKLLVPEPNLSGTVAGADMYYGALAGITFMLLP